MGVTATVCSLCPSAASTRGISHTAVILYATGVICSQFRISIKVTAASSKTAVRACIMLDDKLYYREAFRL